MSEFDRDPEFEDFLKRRSPLHRRLSDFDHAEPSVELDRVVLNRAREAIETPAQPPMFRASRWAMPAGLAATILIAFTLVLNVERHEAKVDQPIAAASAPAATDMAESIALNAPAAPAPAPAAAAAESASVAHADADAWLREIARLRTAGRTADADRELAAFRRAYPGHSGPSFAKPPTR